MGSTVLMLLPTCWYKGVLIGISITSKSENMHDIVWFVADTLMFADKTEVCIQVVSR